MWVVEEGIGVVSVQVQERLVLGTQEVGGG